MQNQDLFISFIIKGSNVVFSNYLTLLMVLVAIEIFINSQVVARVCFFHVVKCRPTCLELHIIFLGVLQFLLLIIHSGRTSF
jgi:hypothetical protein